MLTPVALEKYNGNKGLDIWSWFIVIDCPGPGWFGAEAVKPV